MKAIRYHDICMGHRVVGHEGKCRHLHGHNYRIHFHCEASSGALDALGRVIDFSVIKEKLCMWLEEHWDHKFMAWDLDELCIAIYEAAKKGKLQIGCGAAHAEESFVFVPFNPTAENIAQHLKGAVCPAQLKGTGITVTKIVIEETRKCSVSC